MARKAFEMMMEGMEDAIAFAEGDRSRGRVAAPLDVKRIRTATRVAGRVRRQLPPPDRHRAGLGAEPAPARRARARAAGPDRRRAGDGGAAAEQGVGGEHSSLARVWVSRSMGADRDRHLARVWSMTAPPIRAMVIDEACNC